MSLSIETRLRQIEAFDFRSLHPDILSGTASDRYAGWTGMIYDAARYPRVTKRKKRVAGRALKERMLPVASVAEYFDHFPALELDFTFYRPLLNLDGSPSSNYRVLQEYADHAPEDARFIIKAPQAFFARYIRRSHGGQVSYERNPEYLDAVGCTTRFLHPAKEILGSRLAGVLFQQEYQRKDELPAGEYLEAWKTFFSRIPADVSRHVEIRAAHLIVPDYLSWLRSENLGFAFSHWTWLPSLKDQWLRCGGNLISSNNEILVRLMNPRGMSYQEAFQHAFPFDRRVPELADLPQTRQMINETTALLVRAIEQGKRVHLICNNRVFGSSPLLAQEVARRFLHFAPRFNL